jgi:hypothetical protein
MLLALSGDIDPARVIRTILAVSLFTAGVAVVCVHQRWLVGHQIPSYQLTIGPIKGWIDREGVLIESEHNQTYCPLSRLVSCAVTHEIWVLSFGTDQTFWQTIPFSAFVDPRLARSVAEDLQRIRPPVLAEPVDQRKRMVPEQASQFEVGDDAIEFEGNFYQDSASGTRLLQASKRLAGQTWLSLAVLLGCVIASLLVLTEFRAFYMTVAVLWVLSLLAGLAFKVWRSRRKLKQDGRKIAWYSKGWLDREAYCAMTSIGQSRSTWSFFDHAEITDNVIALYPHPTDACCCLIGREQFATPADWDRAIETVRRVTVVGKDSAVAVPVGSLSH